MTLYEFACAFCIAASLGCATGYLVSRAPFSIRVFDPLLAGMYSIPAILLFPLYVLFFGLGAGSKIAIGATIAFFPVALNTIAGFAYVEKAYVTAARSMGASEAQMFWSVMLPAAFPVVLTGLRIGFIVAFLSILGAETIASLAGLGHRIVTYAESMDPAKMFAYIFFAIIIAFVLNGVVSVVESARGGDADDGTIQPGRRAAHGHRRPRPVLGSGRAALGRSAVHGPPSQVVVALYRFHHGTRRCMNALRTTLYELVTAFSLAIVFGLPLGLIIGLQRFACGAFYPIVLLLYAIPQATILPLVDPGLRHRPGIEDRLRLQPCDLPDHRHDRGRACRT